MSYERISNARQKTVGAKQTAKAVEKGRAKVVFVAKDAERHVVEPVIRACKAKAIPVVEVDSMKMLGKACSIDVRCAVAAILEE
ncbi:large subunit ribosomal protein L7A [Desulfohalotomaculum tongense]|uniref:ribosomal L7Ae/L30e/S12e/Gadd45 family protein n=1 Tax=Desulforadius tongensis TaxID=1216062 RepID=UPI00195C4CAD|nr:ribosomal L7Ae/L30e/S12e/Gadd45 family protein [Desulforadius tongensis]MBM7853820.1 large subunit ribosomal protein L7A [Desulforadius tongensis]